MRKLAGLLVVCCRRRRLPGGGDRRGFHGVQVGRAERQDRRRGFRRSQGAGRDLLSVARQDRWGQGRPGLAEDRAEASIACRQAGPIQFSGELKDGEEVFKQRTSLVFKSMQVVRFFDRKRNALVYLVYSDRVIEGSPQNAVTAIPLMPWPTAR